jgi:hypothetical protein
MKKHDHQKNQSIKWEANKQSDSLKTNQFCPKIVKSNEKVQQINAGCNAVIFIDFLNKIAVQLALVYW